MNMSSSSSGSYLCGVSMCLYHGNNLSAGNVFVLGVYRQDILNYEVAINVL